MRLSLSLRRPLLACLFCFAQVVPAFAQDDSVSGAPIPPLPPQVAVPMPPADIAGAQQVAPDSSASVPIQPGAAASASSQAEAKKSKNTASGKNEPIDIDADDGLEWHQKERVYVAHGHATATKGAMTVIADRLTAYERDAAPKPGTAAAVKAGGAPPAASAQAPAGSVMPGNGNTEIYRIVADGHVHLINHRSDGKLEEAFGDHGVYDLDHQLMILKGRHLHALSADSILTSRDSIEYWQGLGLTIARGKAEGFDRKNGRKVYADLLVGVLKDDAQGKQQLDHTEARGHVVVVTATDYATGEQGRYDGNQDKAWLAGKVHITHGKSQLDGDNAEMDFKTDISRVSNNPGSNRRIVGLMSPDEMSSGNNGGASAKGKDQKTPAPPARPSFAATSVPASALSSSAPGASQSVDPHIADTQAAAGTPQAAGGYPAPLDLQGQVTTSPGDDAMPISSGAGASTAETGSPMPLYDTPQHMSPYSSAVPNAPADNAASPAEAVPASALDGGKTGP